MENRVDHRGSAPSPGPVPLSEFSLDRISDDLELVRNELGLGEVVIIGHSGHALMALESAKKYFDSTPLWQGVEVNLQMVNYVWGILLSEIDISQGLNELERPVFLALGRYDFLVAPPSSWNPLKPHFKKLTLNVFEMSGHTQPYELSLIHI